MTIPLHACNRYHRSVSVINSIFLYQFKCSMCFWLKRRKIATSRTHKKLTSFPPQLGFGRVPPQNYLFLSKQCTVVDTRTTITPKFHMQAAGVLQKAHWRINCQGPRGTHTFNSASNHYQLGLCFASVLDPNTYWVLQEPPAATENSSCSSARGNVLTAHYSKVPQPLLKPPHYHHTSS